MNYLSSLPNQISDIFNDYRENKNVDNYLKFWSIKAWVRDYRSQSENIFITIYDGSTSESLQIICNKDTLSNFGNNNFENLRGACVQVYGNIIKSPAKGQEIELICSKIESIGLVNDKNSILHIKNIQLETLRSHQHLRSRFRTFNYIYKIRSTLLKNIHVFFNSKNFYNLDPNIITTSDCEGAGEVFTITTLDLDNVNKYIKNENNSKNENIYKNDFFSKQAFLTVSSQLQLEALSAGLSRVYTLNPSFRAEKSKTKRHLACFTHLEWEIAFIDINMLMDFSEDLVKFIISETLNDCKTEYEELNKFISKGIINKLDNITNNTFIRITYDEAINLINENKDSIINKYKKDEDNKNIVFELPNWGDDLGSYCEKYICDVIYNRPVFVYNYPKKLKSFYMKSNDNNIEGKETVQAVDLLIPQLGELIGSSIREDSYEKLITRMDELQMDKSKLDWYIELRKNSTFPHGGAGLGFDRLVNVCTLMDGNIREVVPFPVSYQECTY